MSVKERQPFFSSDVGPGGSPESESVGSDTPKKTREKGITRRQFFRVLAGLGAAVLGFDVFPPEASAKEEKEATYGPTPGGRPLDEGSSNMAPGDDTRPSHEVEREERTQASSEPPTPAETASFLDEEVIKSLVSQGRFEEIIKRAEEGGIDFSRFDPLKEDGKILSFGLETDIVGLNENNIPDLFYIRGVLLFPEIDEVSTTNPELPLIRRLVINLAIPDGSPRGVHVLKVWVASDTGGPVAVPVRVVGDDATGIPFGIQRAQSLEELRTWLVNFSGSPMEIKPFFGILDQEANSIRNYFGDPRYHRRIIDFILRSKGAGVDVSKTGVTVKGEIKEDFVTWEEMRNYFENEKSEGGKHEFPKGVLHWSGLMTIKYEEQDNDSN